MEGPGQQGRSSAVTASTVRSPAPGAQVGPDQRALSPVPALGHLQPAGLQRLLPLPLATEVQISGGGERRWLGAVAGLAHVRSQFPGRGCQGTLAQHSRFTLRDHPALGSGEEARVGRRISHWRMQIYPRRHSRSHSRRTSNQNTK